MRGRGARRAGIEIEAVSSFSTAVVIRLTGVVDGRAVACLRDVLSCLESRPLVIDLERCTLASREFGHLLVDMGARAVPGLVACPRVGARLLLGRRADEPMDRIHETVAEALASLAASRVLQAPAVQPFGELCAPVPRDAAYT